MMNLKEIQRRVQLLEQAIAEREKRLNALRRAYESGGNPSAFAQSILVENELRILRKEFEKKQIKLEEAKRELEARLPELEKRYLEKIPEQQKLFKRVGEKVKELLELIEKLSRNIEEVQRTFIPYCNVCDQLGVPRKSLHLRDIPTSLRQAQRRLRLFLENYGGRGHG